MFTADVRVQVPPRAPKKKDILSDVFLFWYVGLEEGGLHPVQAKNMPVACFLARGKVHFCQSAVRRTVNWQKSLPCTAKASFRMSFIFIR